MKVFISWSGDRSNAIAKALRAGLRQVLRVRVFMSEKDIQVGDEWLRTVRSELENTDFGILCLTRAALQSKWVLFEAGALAKSQVTARVIPLLIDLAPGDLPSPLNMFQSSKVANEEDVLELFRLAWRVQKEQDDREGREPLDEGLFSQLFKNWWSSDETGVAFRRAHESAGSPRAGEEPPINAALLDALKGVVENIERVIPPKHPVDPVGSLEGIVPNAVLPLVETSRGRELLVACDTPAYGAFTSRDAFRLIRSYLTSRDRQIKLRMLVPGTAVRERLHKQQFPSTPEDERRFLDDPATQRRLDVMAADGRTVDPRTIETLIGAMEEEEEITLRQLRETHGLEAVKELDREFPLNLWIQTGIQAVFTVPWFGKNPIEYGFRTTDRELVKAFQGIWDRYSGTTGTSVRP